MSAFDYHRNEGVTLQKCLEGIDSFSTGFSRLYVEGSTCCDRHLVAVVICHSDYGSGPLSAEEVLAILSGVKPVVEWETDEDPANDYVHWCAGTEPGGEKNAEKKAVLLAAQLTLCLAGLWPSSSAS
jgi:hypothetical protein